MCCRGNVGNVRGGCRSWNLLQTRLRSGFGFQFPHLDLGSGADKSFRVRRRLLLQYKHLVWLRCTTFSPMSGVRQAQSPNPGRRLTFTTTTIATTPRSLVPPKRQTIGEHTLFEAIKIRSSAFFVNHNSSGTSPWGYFSRHQSLGSPPGTQSPSLQK
jgi:hypothetical protein